MRRNVLDMGYVDLVQSWGSDEGIIEAARMSTAKGFLGWGPHGWACPSTAGGVTCGWSTRERAHPGACAKCGGSLQSIQGDEKLLKFLWDKQHATPFEMAGFIVEVKAPIFVFREWHRHRTQSYNEMSARYVPLPDENYVPSVERLMVNSKTNRQAGTIAGAKELDDDAARLWLARLDAHYARAEELYRAGLEAGVPKELARLPVPVARYSAMRASANLRNWLGFLKLRCDPAAQWEIRQYANVVADLVREKFPRTYEVAHASLGLP